MSKLELAFRSIWSLYGSTAGVGQCLFHETRGWLFDFAWVDRLVALEIQGGSFIRGRHSRGTGMTEDYKKNNAALVLGWRVFYATTDMLQDDPIQFCDQINLMLSYPVLFPNAERSMWLSRVRNLTRDGAEICANGITVRRKRLRQYLITTSKGEFTVKGECDDVLEFILGNKAATPNPVQYSLLNT